MSLALAVLIALSELFSAFLVYRLWLKKEPLVIKVIGSLVVLFPFAGPILYLFVMDQTKPQNPRLKNTGPGGEYTHLWIAEHYARRNKFAEAGQFREKGKR